jgi:hypothetical protein
MKQLITITIITSNHGYIHITPTQSVVAIGGSGGCVAGYSTTDIDLINADNYDQFCRKCGSGNYSARVGSDECSYCTAGKWSINEGATFCYKCEQAEWCPGGDRCELGSEGTMCAQCIKVDA